MATDQNHQKTLEDVRRLVESADPPGLQRRNGRSPTERIGAMAGVTPAQVPAEAPSIRAMLAKIRPAAHGMTSKTWANVLSRFRQELRLADVIDPNWQGCAARHPAWAPLVQAIAGDKRLSTDWLSSSTGAPPGTPLLKRRKQPSRSFPPGWSKGPCAQSRAMWCAVFHSSGTRRAKRSTFGPRSSCRSSRSKLLRYGLQWGDLPASFRVDAEAYLAMRANPDPIRREAECSYPPLGRKHRHPAERTHLRLAASVLIESGVPVEDITSLADLGRAGAVQDRPPPLPSTRQRTAECLRSWLGHHPHSGRPSSPRGIRGADRAAQADRLEASRHSS